MTTLLSNPTLIASLSSWLIAQIIKVPLDYIRTKSWNWALLLRAGGMPSSHSALMAGAAHAVGLYQGFDSPLFGLAVAIAVIVIYDATGIRRQSGKHAALINEIIRDLTHRNIMWRERGEQLREVLGHTPLEALAGTLLGIFIAQLSTLVYPT